MTDEEKDWQTNHGNFIEAFLLFLNKQTDQFVLKGGTALSLCYGLDRFSEDIDLDGRKQDIKEIVNDNVPVPLRQTSEDEENQKLTRLEIKA